MVHLLSKSLLQFKLTGGNLRVMYCAGLLNAVVGGNLQSYRRVHPPGHHVKYGVKNYIFGIKGLLNPVELDLLCWTMHLCNGCLVSQCTDLYILHVLHSINHVTFVYICLFTFFSLLGGPVSECLSGLK